MSKMLQVRHVPDDVHRLLKVKAATAGQSLSDYVLAELKIIAKQPTLTEWVARVRTRSPVSTKLSPAEIIRQHRGPI